MRNIAMQEEEMVALMGMFLWTDCISKFIFDRNLILGHYSTWDQRQIRNIYQSIQKSLD